MKLLQCVSLLLCLHFVKSRGFKPNILKTSGNQDNKNVLNTGEDETNNREKETEITSNKDDVINEVYNIPVKKSLKRNNELYNLKNNFGIKHLNNENRLVDKTLMNARKQNSKVETDKKRKDNGDIILNNLNPSRRYIHIDPGLNSILDSFLLDNDGLVRHINYYGRSIERLEDYNYYHRARQLGREKGRETEKYEKSQRKPKREKGKKKMERGKAKTKRAKSKTETGKGKTENGKGKAERGKKKRREERKKQLEKERTKKRQVEQQKLKEKKKTEYKHQRTTPTGYSKKSKKTPLFDTEFHQGLGKSAVKLSNFILDATESLLGDIIINGKRFSFNDLKNKNVVIEY